MRCSWWIRRSRWCKRCIVLVLILITVLVYAGHTVVKQSRCSEEDSHKLLEELCDLYNKGEVAGSFCSPLCGEKRLHYDRCTNYREGKKVIFMTCDQVCEKQERVKVVFKTKTLLQERERLPPIMQMNSQWTHEDLSRFKRFVDDMIQMTFYNDIGVNLTDYVDRLTFAWGWNYDKFILNNKDVKNVRFVGADSIVSLVMQYEYALMKFMSDKVYIPTIYGTCGPAYIVEFTETLNNYEYNFLYSSFFTWKERVSIALKLIDLIHTIETEFHQPLHLCDIKLDNFGLRYKSDVSLIDVDCAMFEDKLYQQFKYSNCTTHDDCDFFDCRGFCDTNTHKCLQTRTNNNMQIKNYLIDTVEIVHDWMGKSMDKVASLQSVCEDVFIGLSAKFPTGLLRDPPHHSKTAVFEALSDCAFPSGSTDRHTTRAQASREAVDKLKRVLKNSLIT